MTHNLPDKDDALMFYDDPCFYDKLWGLLKTKLGDSVECDEMTDRVMDLVREHIPKRGVLLDYE